MGGGNLIWGPRFNICVNSVKNDFTSHLTGWWEVLFQVAYRAVSCQLYVYRELALPVACRQFVAVLGTIFTFLFVVLFKYFVDATVDFSHISALFNDALGNKLFGVGGRWINVSMEPWKNDTDGTKLNAVTETCLNNALSNSDPNKMLWDRTSDYGLWGCVD